MAYVRQNFRNGNILDASELIHIEDGIAAIEQALAEVPESALPTLNIPGSASDLAQGKQLIAQDGTVVTGTVETVTGVRISPINDGNTAYYDNNPVFQHTFAKNVLFRAGSTFETSVDGTQLGNARPEDVRAGVTFTSVSGLLVEGTNNFRDIKTITIEEV